MKKYRNPLILLLIVFLSGLIGGPAERYSPIPLTTFQVFWGVLARILFCVAVVWIFLIREEGK